VSVFRYDAAIVERFPAIVGGVLVASGVANGPTPASLSAAYAEEQRLARERLGVAPLATLPSLAAWRRAFSAFGVEPTKYRSASEALLRRLSKQGRLPSLGLLVDLGNLVSIRYALPVAVFDRRGVAGSIAVRFARGDEAFTDLGSEVVDHPVPGEVVFVDERDVVCARRWCWRQSAGSATQADTSAVLITVEGHHEGARRDVEAAVDDLRRLLAEHAPGARVASDVLSAERRSFEVSRS
jgi:DNA/RNA-binding domain of Phe-tRNA-synthetase-like protein